MTLEGVAQKSLMLLFIVVTTGYFSWRLAASDFEFISAVIIGSLILGLITAVVTIFKKTLAPITAPIYALFQGVLLGAISQFYEAEFDGIVLQAIMLTLGIFISMLLLYRFRLIQATENLKLGIAAATGGIMLYYVANLVINFFGTELPLINSTSVFGIGFTVIVIIVAALNLVLDFDFVEQGVEKRAPKYMEWYASFGLLVTIIWLYIEILRLLSKLRSR